MKMNTAIVGLGSNIDPVENMERARDRLKKNFTVTALSSFIWTEPVGPTGQPPYLNGVVMIKTEWESDLVIQKLKSMEREMGRRSSRDRYAPRTIDLDLLLWNGQVVDEDVHARPFLIKAIQEILPHWTPDPT